MKTLNVKLGSISTIEYIKKVECNNMWSLGEPVNVDDGVFQYDLSSLYLCDYCHQQALKVHFKILEKLNIEFEVI